METPASLLERLRKPAAERAWARFVDLYTPVLYSWTRRLGLQESDAADLVQNVFTVLVVKLPEFDYERGGSCRGWLRTILLNRWRNRGRWPVPVSLDAAPDPAAPAASDAFPEVEYRRHLVRRALELMQAEFEPSTWRAC